MTEERERVRERLERERVRVRETKREERGRETERERRVFCWFLEMAEQKGEKGNSLP